MWEDGQVSIALLPSGEQGQELLALVRDWTRESLLGPALWVLPEQVTSTPGQPPVVTATIVRGGREGIVEREVDLFETLARERLTRVRLIKVRSPRVDQETDDAQDTVADSVSRYVGYSMPLSDPSRSGSSDRPELERLTLICAPTSLQIEDRVESSIHDAGILVVASPEDRATPTSGDAFVRENERFGGFVLMHLATIGGLWNGLTTGSLELFPREASIGRQIWIPRVFVSGVLTDGLTHRAAAQVLSEVVASSGGVSSGGVPFTVAGTAEVPESAVPRYIDGLAEAALRLDDSALDYRRPDAVPTSAPDVVTVGGQLGLFVRFAADKVRQIPHWTGLWFHDRFAREINRQLQGPDGMRSVEIRMDRDLDARDRLLIESARSFAQVPGAAVSAPREAVRTTPRLWAGLRDMAFGAVDGSADLDLAGFQEIEGLRPVLPTVRSVAPADDDVWELPARSRIRGVPDVVDWRAYRAHPEIQSELTARSTASAELVATARAKLEEQQAVFDAALAEIERLENSLIELGAIEDDGEGGLRAVVPETDDELTGQPDPAQADPAQVRAIEADLRKAHTVAGRADRKLAPLRTKLETLEASHQLDEETLASFELWAVGIESSFAWQTMARMDRARGIADADLARAEGETLDLPEPGALVRLRKRFHKGLLILVIVDAVIAAALLLPLLFAVVYRDSDDRGRRIWARGLLLAVQEGKYPTWWETVIGAIIVLIVVLVMLLSSYYRGWSQFERRIRDAERRMAAVYDHVRSLRVEVQRLATLHAQAEIWLDLLGRALHRPWRIPEEWLASGTGALDSTRLPFALHVAAAVEGRAAGSERLKGRAASELLRRGWRADAFRDLVAEVAGRLGLPEAQFSVTALDNDLPEVSNNSRRRLADWMSEDEVLTAVALRRLREMVEGLQDKSLYSAGTTVRPLGADPLADFRAAGTALTSTWRDFLTSTLGSASAAPTPLSPLSIAASELQSSYHEKVMSYILAPNSIATELDAAADGTRVVIRPYESPSNQSFDVAVRVDMVGPVPATALSLWKRRADAAPAEEPAVPVRDGYTGI